MRKILFFLLIGGMSAVMSQASAQSSFLNTLQGIVQGATSNTQDGTLGSALPYDDIVAGLREALRVGSERVTAQLGAADGYNTDTSIHIPLPPELRDVQSTLRKFHLSGLADDIELKLNRAAEAAAPKTKELIWKAITDMTIDDAKRIYDGPDDAATQYFKKVASADLSDVVRPVVDQSLADVGALNAYDSLTSQYNSLPFIPDLKGNLTDHAVDGALKGLFHYLASEEAAIRQNPAKRTTELLTRVFGN
ncbi:MAG: DUF4197 domain-containing protein [Rhodospirillales bacterium]|jgi:hypothetical protein|nr:DUF4197 domain-containing protein [Rhodospirillales bacterium]